MRTSMTCLFVLASALAARAAETPSTQPALSNTTYSLREVVWTGANLTPAMREALRNFTLREGKKQLGLDGLYPILDVGGGYGTISRGGGRDSDAREQRMTITLDLPPNAPKKAAKELMDQIVPELRRVLLEEFEKPYKQRAALEQRQTALKNDIQSIDDTIAGSYQKIGAVTRQADTSSEAVRAAMSKLDQECQTLAVDLVGIEARHEALQKTIADQSKRMEDRVQVDPICQELQKVVAARTENLEQAKKMVQAAVASSTDLSTAVVALAEVKAKFLERQEVVAARSGGDLLAAWNRELLNLSIDKAEKSAKAKFIDKQLDSYRDAGAILRNIDKLHDAHSKLDRELKELELRLGGLFQRYSQSEDTTPKPTVSVIKAEDR